MSVPFRSTWLGFSSFSLFCIQFKVYPHQLSVADWVVREVPAGSDVPQPSSIFPLVISSTFPFHTRIQLSKGVFSLSLPVKRAGNLFSYQIWWYLVVVVVVVEIACQFMISLVIHSRGFHVTLTFFSLVDSVEIPLSDRWPACSFEGQWFSSRVKGLEGDWVMTFFLKCQAWRKWHLKLGSYVCGRGIPSDSRGGFLLTLTVFDVKTWNQLN
jgi:hypothetical protein